MRRPVAPPGTGPSPGDGDASVAVHRPLPSILMIYPSGMLDEHTARRLADHVDAAVTDVLHVVIDLRSVTPVTRDGARTLLDLDRRATRHGAVLHLAGIDAHGLLRHLVDIGLLRGARTGAGDPPGGVRPDG